MVLGLPEIRKRRKAAGLTQDSLSKLSGVSQGAIAKIERGKVDPRYSAVKALFEALAKAEKGTVGSAGDVANRRLVSVGPRESMGKAVSLLKRRGISQIPVVENGRVVGSISERTILDNLAQGKTMGELEKERVEKIMEEPFPIVDKKTGIGVVEGLLKENSAVLVSEKGKLQGIITKSDLLKPIRKL